jgi:signal transduction histidine kinase
MQKNIARAHTLIQSFKNLSVSQIVDTKETLSLPEVVNEILSLFSIQARKARLEIEFRNGLAEHEQSWVGYRGHLSRILLNLLTNVERYAYPADTGGRVEVSLESQTGGGTPRFVLSVRDWGSGIAPEHLPQIFDPFFTTGRGRGGSGLGLAMVYNLVSAALHGTVKARSAPGEGTTITVIFPRVIPD